MGRKRTTSCAQPHYGGPCEDCHAQRMRRYRARRLHAKQPETRSEADRAAARARAYVAEYLRRGAIAPPANCERCGWEPSDVQGRHSPRLLPLQPDPARPRQLAWLCRPCRTVVRSSGEALTLRWQWPGTAPQSPRHPVLKQACVEALAAVRDRFALAGLNAYAAAHELLDRLAAPERERLYAALASARNTARPTGDGAVDEALRAWAREQQRERCDPDSLGITVELPPPKPRKRRSGTAEPSDTPAHERTPLVPIDPEKQRRRMEAAVSRLEEAEAAAEAANERVLAALGKMVR